MRPSLLLDFANTRRLDPRVTFTRASVGTYYDRNGVLKTAAVNEPRFDFDPVTGYCKGLLIEEARTNLLTYSEQFDNAAWAKTNASVTANAIAAPDGTLSADKLVEDSTSNAHYVGGSCSFTSGASYAFSVYAKAGERSVLQISFPSTAFSSAYANFDLSAGVVSATNNVTASITPVGGGVYRCSAVATATASSLSNAGLVIQTSPTAARLAIYQGDGVSGLYVWGAQLEAGAFATSYIPTTSAAVTRSADVGTMQASGWLNPAEWTLLAEASVPALAAGSVNQTVASLSVGASYNESVNLFAKQGSGSIQAVIVANNSGSTIWNATGAAAAANAKVKMAVGYGAAAYSVVAGGIVMANATSAGVVANALTLLNLGSYGSGLQQLNGHIARIACFPRNLSTADKQELTR